MHKLEVFRLFRNVLCGENDRLRNDGRCQHLEAADEEERGGRIIVFVFFSFFVEKLRNGNPARTVEMLERRIADEFRMKEYIWTGDIDVDLFSLKCVFTDPTLSFTGLETFRDNLESLQPSLRRIAPEGKRRVELRECGKDEDSDDVVVAKWRMVGNLQLPWRPKIDIQGETRFQFRRERVDDVEEEVGERERKGGEEGESESVSQRVSYRETWSETASEALWQLVTPFAHEKE